VEDGLTNYLECPRPAERFRINSEWGPSYLHASTVKFLGRSLELAHFVMACGVETALRDRCDAHTIGLRVVAGLRCPGCIPIANAALGPAIAAC
jgi:hypothetical protein